MVASYTYDAFGNITVSTENFTGASSGWSNPYRYDGAEGVRYDPETGLYWMSVRAYDPTLGRFISHDPLGRLAAWGLDLQPYVYVGGNPINQSDPSGLVSCRGSMPDGYCIDIGAQTGSAPCMAQGGCDSLDGSGSDSTVFEPIKITKTPKPTDPPGGGNCPLGVETCNSSSPQNPSPPKCDWGNPCNQKEFNNGLAGTIWWGLGLIGLIGSYLVPGGVGLLLSFVLHGQANNIVHGLISSVQELFEGVYGSTDQAVFDLLRVIGDALLLVMTIVDGVSSLKYAYKEAGDWSHVMTKFVNLLQHGLNGRVLGGFLGDVGQLLWQWFPNSLSDWDALAASSHKEWGWNLPSF